jgi:hypothetical protein
MAGAVPGCLIRLCGGSDVLGGAVGGRGAGVDLGWWFEQAAAQVVQQAEPVGCGVHAAPAAGGAVQHGPWQGEAAGLPGQAADDRSRRTAHPAGPGSHPPRPWPPVPQPEPAHHRCGDWPGPPSSATTGRWLAVVKELDAIASRLRGGTAVADLLDAGFDAFERVLADSTRAGNRPNHPAARALRPPQAGRVLRGPSGFHDDPGRRGAEIVLSG